MESYKKFNEKAQTVNFSDFTRQRQELCAENAKKNTKTGETKTQFTQSFERYDLIGGYHMKADVLRIPKKWYFLGVRLFKGELLAVKVK